MPTRTISLGQKPYVSPYTSIGREISKNVYLERSTSDTSKVPFYKVGCPGAVLMRSTGDHSGIPASVAGRGICTATGRTFFVAGLYFAELLQNGSVQIISHLQTSVGVVRFDNNGDLLFIVDGRAGYTYDLTSGTFNTVTDSYYPGISDGTSNAPNFVECLNSYFLVNEQNTDKYYWSTPKYIAQAFDADQPSIKNYWYGLYYAEAKIRPGHIVALAKMAQYLLVFTNTTIEVHEDTALETNTWQRVSSTFMNVGTTAPASVSTYQNYVFWLGNDINGTVGIFMAGMDFSPIKISERGIEQIIQSFDDLTDCIATSFAMDGHVFTAFYFPTADRTFVYDLVTQSWHERTYLDPNTGIDHAWRMSYTTYNWSRNIFQDRLSSAIYYLDSDYFKNDNPDGNGVNYINVDFTTPLEFSNGHLLRYCGAQVVCQQGVGLNTNEVDGTGANPVCRLSWSNDAGSTFSNEVAVAMGAIGAYSQRTRRVNLSAGRNRQFRIRCTAPVRRVFSALILDVMEYAR